MSADRESFIDENTKTLQPAELNKLKCEPGLVWTILR